jgi:hypothetical protein
MNNVLCNVELFVYSVFSLFYDYVEIYCKFGMYVTSLRFLLCMSVFVLAVHALKYIMSFSELV